MRLFVLLLALAAAQGAIDSSGRMPATFDAQVRLTLDNVKSVVEGAVLTEDRIFQSGILGRGATPAAQASVTWSSSTLISPRRCPWRS
jgi:enamine deaminase RidA (YjgF/YER057c/UK114 family)